MRDAGLPRKLGLFDSTALLVGLVIGSGIFLSPQVVARTVPSEGMVLAVWIAAGLLVLVGALAYAELGAMMPATGGHYIYLREAYGPMFAFLCGWSSFAVVWPGAIATLAVAFAIYLGQFLPLTPWLAKLAAVTLIATLTLLNRRGVRQGATTQNILTVAKVAGLGILIFAAFWSRETAQTEWTLTPAGFSWIHFGMAVVACSWAYDGWYGISFVAGEIKRPARNLPAALVLGTGIIMTVYLLANFAYLRILPVEVLAATERVGAEVAGRTMGSIGAGFVTVAILVSIAGAINGCILAAPRVYFAQARDGLFFSKLGEVHPRFQTPAVAIAAQGAWSSVLALTGSFEALLTYTMFATWLFSGLTVAGLILLRIKRPELTRPYRMWGYPVTPLLFTGAALALVGSAVAAQPVPSLIGFALIAGGIPLYFAWRRRRRMELQDALVEEFADTMEESR
jgi:basic amino acid/polyamine antiporter, APA family